MRVLLFGIMTLLIILFIRVLSGMIAQVMNRGGERRSRGVGPLELDRCFKVLELRPGASEEEVNQAYRDLANVWHPDRFANNRRLQKKAEEKLKEINAAYGYIRSFYRWK
jgi:DnaJ-domain-containing protein 1